MISSLIKKGDSYYCSNCMMRQYTIKGSCWYCEKIFGNFEDVVIDLYKTIEANNCKIQGQLE